MTQNMGMIDQAWQTVLLVALGAGLGVFLPVLFGYLIINILEEVSDFFKF